MTMDNKIQPGREDSGRLRESLRKLNKIGTALSQEKDLDRLLAMILTSARNLVGCDAGSLYLVQKAQDAEPSLV